MSEHGATVSHIWPAPRQASRHFLTAGAAPQHLPDEAWPLTEQPWPCATGHHWKSRSLWWKQCHCPNCSYNWGEKKPNQLITLYLACLEKPGACQTAQMFSVPHSLSPTAALMAQILRWPVASFGTPTAVYLFGKVRLVELQAKFPPSQIRVSTIITTPHEQEKDFCTTVPSQNRRLWRSLTNEPLPWKK